MGLYSNDPAADLRECELLVEQAILDVHAANQAYIKACSDLAQSKVAYARANPHPWFGMPVYRIMGGDKIRNRLEYGVVCFKEYETDDYGNPRIAPGSYYVLISGHAGKSAHALTKEWEIDLL